MKHSWELYPGLTRVVERDHEMHECGHHPFEHALMVAQYALIIAPDEETGLLAAVAGLIHNTDRLLPGVDVKPELLWYLGKTDLTEINKQKIVTAVLKHGNKNSDDDEPVTICLKDADRLANISPFDIIARASRAYLKLPLFDTNYIKTIDPDSTYQKPGTIFRDAILSTLEWETWLRLPKAQELARPYFEGLRMVQKLTVQQVSETFISNYK